MALFHVTDGYTLSGYIAELEGQHPALSFKYRPITQEKRAEMSRVAAQSSRQAISVQEELQTYRKLVLKQLQSWDAKDASGTTLPITELSLSRLESRLFDRLVNIVGGFSVSDQPPNEPDFDLRTAAEREAADQGN